eukprot:symbB.v1.2.040724.t1/scaffold7471.1/size11065/1
MGTVLYAIGANKPNTSNAQTIFLNGCAGERLWPRCVATCSQEINVICPAFLVGFLKGNLDNCIEPEGCSARPCCGFAAHAIYMSLQSVNPGVSSECSILMRRSGAIAPSTTEGPIALGTSLMTVLQLQFIPQPLAKGSQC